MKGLVLLLITLGLAKSLLLDTEDTEVEQDEENGGKCFSFYFNCPFRNSKKDWVLVYTLLKLHLIKEK